MDTIQQLYPEHRPVAFPGLYLAHDLRRLGNAAKPYVYANFVSSLDGRIAVPRPDGDGLTVPGTIANDRDWRLFQELAAQADLIISSGRYLREWAAGRAQEILRVDDPRFADLRAWRQARNLPPQPDIVIVSGSLRFPVPDLLTAGGRRFVVVTSGAPDPARVADVEAQGGRVVIAGETAVDGGQMVARLGALGYRTIYSAAGPRILHLLASAGALDRLYLTHASRLLGGTPYAGIVDGPLFQPAVDMRLHALYQDAAGLEGLGQLFLSYDRV